MSTFYDSPYVCIVYVLYAVWNGHFNVDGTGAVSFYLQFFA